MTIEEVKQKAQKVVLTMLPDVDETDIADNKDIFNLGLDSINAMSLIFSLQDEFGIQFETSEISFENFRTIEDIANLIGKKKDL